MFPQMEEYWTYQAVQQYERPRGIYGRTEGLDPGMGTRSGAGILYGNFKRQQKEAVIFTLYNMIMWQPETVWPAKVGCAVFLFWQPGSFTSAVRRLFCRPLFSAGTCYVIYYLKLLWKSCYNVRPRKSKSVHRGFRLRHCIRKGLEICKKFDFTWYYIYNILGLEVQK